MPFFSCSHHVSVTGSRVITSHVQGQNQARRCRQNGDDPAPWEAAVHHERSLGIWQSCFILCGATRALHLLRRMPLLEARTRSAGGLSAPKSRASITYSTVLPPASRQHANNCCREAVARGGLTLFYSSSTYLQFLITRVTKNKADHAFAWSRR